MLIFAAIRTVTSTPLPTWNNSRLGLIRIENFDQFLVHAYQQMQARGAGRVLLATADENISAHLRP